MGAGWSVPAGNGGGGGGGAEKAFKGKIAGNGIALLDSVEQAKSGGVGKTKNEFKIIRKTTAIVVGESLARCRFRYITAAVICLRMGPEKKWSVTL